DEEEIENAIVLRLEIIVVRKIIAYILIFLIEWSTVVIYFISQMVKFDNIWIYTLAVVTSNSSGIGNTILYITYENWTNKYSSPKNSVDPNDSNQNTNKSSNATSKDLESND
ncbi:7804_t:CDS:2, partial [Scutellospora calospora]